MVRSLVEDDRSGDHRAGQRAAPDLVDAGHQAAHVDDQSKLLGAKKGPAVHGTLSSGW